MKLVQLQSGQFETSIVKEVEQGSHDVGMRSDRKALLVYAGQFESIEGPVTISPDHIQRIAANHNGFLSKLSRIVTGEVPLKFCPPVQLDHSRSARDTVGRLIGPLEMGEHDLGDGTKAVALYGQVRILGRENIEKVADGRWTHLSIGADLDDGKITELTITPFPAASQASIMSKGNAELRQANANELSLAFDLGVEAHKNGKPRAPAQNDELMALLESIGSKVGEGSSLLKEFIKGWDSSNLEMSSKDESKTKMSFREVHGKHKGHSIHLDEKEGKHAFGLGKDGFVHASEFSFENAHAAYMAALKYVDEHDDSKIDPPKAPKEPKKELESKANAEDVNQQPQGETKMAKHHLDEMKKAHLKKHLLEHHKMSEADADKKLAEIDDEGAKKLESEIEEGKKHLSEQSDSHNKEDHHDDQDAEKHMSAMKERASEICKLSADFKKTTSVALLAAKKSKLSVRLSKLKAEGKISPAELKKVDLTKLAGANEATVNAVFDTYESREPVILTGQLGSMRAVDLSKLSEQSSKAKLEAETRANMPLKRVEMENAKSSGVKLEGSVISMPKQAPTVDMAGEESMPQQDAVVDMAKHLKHLAGLLDEGKHDEAKEHVGKMMKYCEASHGAGHHSGEAEAEMSALAENVERMQTQFEKLVQLSSEITGIRLSQ